MKRGTGGKDIIDEDGTCGRDWKWTEEAVADAERVFEVFLAGLAPQCRLCAGGANALQARQKR